MLIFMRILPISFLGTTLAVAMSERPGGSMRCRKADGMAKFKRAVPRTEKIGVKDRRTSPRFSQTEIPDLQTAKLLDGPAARLINISRGGILLETAECMMPGGIVYIRLVAADAVFLLRGKVLRSRPSLMRNLSPSYETAVSLDGTLPVPVGSGDGFKGDVPRAIVPSGQKSGLGVPDDQTAALWAPSPATYTVTAPVPRSGPDLNQIFGLNSW